MERKGVITMADKEEHIEKDESLESKEEIQESKQFSELEEEKQENKQSSESEDNKQENEQSSESKDVNQENEQSPASNEKDKEKKEDKQENNQHSKKKSKQLKEDKVKQDRKHNKEHKKEQKKEPKQEEEQEQRDEQTPEKSKKSHKKVILITSIIIIVLALLCVAGYFAYVKFCPKFQDVSIELGTNEVTLEQFVAPNFSLEKASFVTDMSTIDFSKIGSYEIELNYDGVIQTVHFNIVDTTPPVVEFQNTNQYLDYELNADDFIKTKTDLSEMTTSILNAPEINGIGTYSVTVEVKDAAGNVTSQTCELNITRVVKEFTLELGDKLEKKDVLLNIEEDADTIDQDDIDKINKSGVGEYELISDLDGSQEIIKIIVQDTKAPTLTLKNVTIYDDETVSGKNAFIQSCEDASDEVTTTLKTEINYSKIGEQEIVLEAVDSSGNKTEKKATLTIREDTEGPVFYGLSNISVDRNGSVNFKSGVSAVDAKDGTVSFTVDTSNVKLNVAGTYYAKYTAKDKKGNTTTRNRRIVVNHNQEDTNNKFNEFYNNYLAGKSVSGIISEVRNRIKYNSNWGGDDPIWYGLTNYSGNCYVHAMIVKKALDKQGIRNQLIYVTDRSHYWNLVYQDGKWRHYDATPTDHIPGPATDEEKANSSAMRGRTWSSSFPKAE